MFDAFDRLVGIEPVAVFEYPRAGNGVVDTAVFLMCLLEEMVQVVVFRHIALNEGDVRTGLASGVDVSVDIAEDDECAVLH